MHPTDREGKAGRPLPGHAHCRLAGEDETIDEARIDQHRVERGGALIEVDDADGVHVEPHEIDVPIGQDRAQSAEDDETLAIAELDDEGELEVDHDRRAPADLDERTEKEAASA